MRSAAFALAAWGAACAPALAGAWPQPRGDAQVIMKWERMQADQAFDPDGLLVDLAVPREDEALSLYGEYGLTDRLTLVGRTEWQSGEDQFADYSGRGPSEIGLRYTAWRDERTSVAVQGVYAAPGEGRNAGYAAPGEGEGDWEIRLLAGRSGQMKRLWRGAPVFAELQAARRFRAGLPDETRLDATVGVDISENWSLMSQVFAGQGDGEFGPR
ncbi:hypothetical protein [Peiella sedimenti]|uniref:hypothetical protein n=1 Tax=Peiella sedimenti TaxID=3061083 RepID=UPI003137A139